MAAKETRSKCVEYHEGQFWFVKRGNILTLGLTEDALESIGEAEDISLPEPGVEFDCDDVIVEIDGAEGGISLVTPVTGIVTEANKDLKNDITILNDDPTDDGWLVRIEMSNEEELKEYL